VQPNEELAHILSSGLGIGIFLVLMVIAIAFFVFFAMAWMKIAQKLGYEPAWLAWIPVANYFLMAGVADLPIWMPIALAVGMFIPFINWLAGIGALVFSIYVVLVVARKLAKPEWYCVGYIIPLLQLWVIYDLGWNGEPISTASAATYQPPSDNVPPPPPTPPAQ